MTRGFANALITGASSGLGRVLAAKLAARGTRVVLAARRAAELEAAAREIRGAGGRADVQVLDVADDLAAREAVLRWDRETGGLDLVLANAGIGPADEAHLVSHDDLMATLRVNTLGAVATLRAAIDPMLARGHGALVGVSSLAGLRGFPRNGSYSASKAALSNYLEGLRVELAPRGLSVIDIRPGYLRSAMTAGNDFPMPCLLELDDAAERCLRGIDRGRAVVAFPWQLNAAMGLLRLMPDGLYRFLARRLRAR